MAQAVIGCARARLCARRVAGVREWRWGRWGAGVGVGWDGCVWGSRGMVRVQAEVVLLAEQD